jgi:tRNA threonylcarbamoyladenosine biosynthesis protein TsaB
MSTRHESSPSLQPTDAPPLAADQRTGRFVAFDTSTERMSVAVAGPDPALAASGQIGTRVWHHEGPGAAQSSATLIPEVMRLLAASGQQLADLDALVFGRGPGSFTGLRCACAVAQGLAQGAGLPVLAVDTLLALAEEARFAFSQAHPGAHALRVTAALDARMNEIYVQDFSFDGQQWIALDVCRLTSPEALQVVGDSTGAPHLFAGNVATVYADRLAPLPDRVIAVHALPTAVAMLRLAPALLASGRAVSAAAALPLYIRDKVAFTTEERALAKTHDLRTGAPLPPALNP